MSNTYNTADRVATQTYGTGTISYTYSLSGSSVTQNTVLDRLGHTTNYYYDGNGNNTQTTYYTATGSVTNTYTYNDLGYMTSETRPNNHGTKYSYDSKGNLVEKRVKADMTQADSSNNDLITYITYNSKNQVLTTTNPIGVMLTNTYDTNGNLTQLQTSELKTSAGDNYSTTQTFTYDNEGNLVTSTDGLGVETNYTYS